MNTSSSTGRVGDLAVCGGSPAFAQPLHVGRPNIADRARLFERFNDMLDRRWLSNNGPFVQEFERRLCHLIGVRHCIPVCNATVGLEIAIRAAQLHGEVIVPSYTFVATAHALQWQEITPVFCDVDERTHTLDPEQVERLITPRTTGIIGTHVWGRPCAIDALTEIAARHGLTLMFDAAHAFACSHRGRMIGGFGRAEVFSFHATKFLNSFEGGAIATDDDELAARIRLMKNFGFAGYDKVVFIGTNGKMTEVCAAMGLTSLEGLDDLVEVNRRNYHAYVQALAGVPSVSLLKYDESERCNFQYIVIELDPDTAGLTRDELVAVLHAENVIARRYFWPGCHRMEPYRSYFPHAGLLLPRTERMSERVIVLPTGTAISAADIDVLCGIVKTALSDPDPVRRGLASGSNKAAS
ncbi:MAG: aminotransferase class I/II-fold pyridoxal phosphate-dependent enzyme [Limisphaerales bacterium]